MIMTASVKEFEKDTWIEIDEDLSKRILKCAVNDFLGYRSDREICRTASQWLFTDSDDDEVVRQDDDDAGFVSLFTVCDMLELDHEKLRIYVNCKLDQGKKRLVFGEFEHLLQACGRG